MAIQKILFLCVFAFLLSSCGRDRNINDYNDEQAQNNKARMQPYIGIYRGVMTGNQENAPISAITIEFSADAQPVSNTGKSTTEQQISMQGQITLDLPGRDKRILVFKKGTFTYITHELTVNVPILLSSGESQIIELIGSFNDNSFIGNLQAAGFKEFGGNFNIVKNAPPVDPNSINHILPSATGLDTNLRGYTGLPEFTDKKPSQEVVLTLSIPQTSAEQLFTDFFLPIKTVTVGVSYKNSPIATGIIRNAKWDLRNKVLMGSDNSTGIELKIECDQITPQPHVIEWDCDYFSSARNGLVFTGVFKPI